MTQPDFRALCAELVTAFKDESTYTQRVEILDRARAALATPQPEPPTDEDLDELWDESARYFNLYEEARVFARAVLEKWGKQ